MVHTHSVNCSQTMGDSEEGKICHNISKETRLCHSKAEPGCQFWVIERFFLTSHILNPLIRICVEKDHRAF